MPTAGSPLVRPLVANFETAAPSSSRRAASNLAPKTVTDLADASAVCPIEIANPVGTHEAERSSRWAWRKLRDEDLGKSVGAPWIDLLGLLPDLQLGGGPDPHEAFAAHPVGAAAPAGEVDCMLASLAGYFTRQSMQPAIPGVAGLREFQGAQGRGARRWLARRLRWEPEA